jgi:hypothetical protein
VVELLGPPTRRLLRADEVARLLAVDVAAFVSTHQSELVVRCACRARAGGRHCALRP